MSTEVKGIPYGQQHDQLSTSLLEDLQSLFETSKDPMTRSALKLEAGELRNLAILFLDIQGFTTLSERLKAEEVHKLIDRIFKILTNLIQRHDGYVDKYLGDGLLAVFGGKGKAEACCERAVRAGLSVLDSVGSINEILSPHGIEIKIRIGINYGEVSIGSVGSLGTWDTVMGDTVNTAQRIQSAARPNTILVTRSITRMLGDAFLYTNERDIIIKGKADALPVVEVSGVNVRKSERWERHHLAAKIPFVGRIKELDMLSNICDEAKLTCYPPEFWDIGSTEIHYRNRLIGVKGGAGFGKSRLVNEFFRRLRLQEGSAPLIIIGECPNYPTSYLHPFASMLYRELQLSPNASPKEKTFYLESFYQELLESLPDTLSSLKERLLSTKIAVFHQLSASADYSKFNELDAKSEDIEKRLGFRSIIEALYYKKNLRHLDIIKDFWDKKPSTIRASVNKPGRKIPPLPEDCPLNTVIILVDDLHFAQSATVDYIQFLLETTCLPQPMIVMVNFRTEYHLPPTLLKCVQPVEVMVGELREIELRTILSAMLDGYRIPLELELEIFKKCDGNPFYLEEIVYYMLVEGFLVFDESAQGYQLTRPLSEFRIPAHLNDLAVGRIDSLDKPLKVLAQKASVLGREFSYGDLVKLEERLGLSVNGEIENALETLVDAQILIRKEEGENGKGEDEAYMFRHAIQQEAAYRTLLYRNRRTLHRIAAEIYEEKYADDIDGHVEFLAYHNENAGNLAKACEYWIRFAEILNLRGQFKQCSEVLERVPKIIAQIEDSPEVALQLSLKAKIAQAHVYISLLRHQEAEDLCQEAGAIARVNGLQAFIADVERTMGIICRERHRYLNAEEQFNGSLVIARELGDKRREARALNNLGLLYWELQQYDRSLEMFAQALEIAKELGQKREIAAALNNTGLAYGHKSGYKEGLDYLEEALLIVQDVGDRWAEANVLANIGLFHANRGRYDLVKQYTPKAERIRAELGIKGRALTAWWV